MFIAWGHMKCRPFWRDVPILLRQVKQAGNRHVALTVVAPRRLGLLPLIELAALTTTAVPEIARPERPRAVQHHPEHEPGIVVSSVIGDRGQGTRHWGIVRRAVRGTRLRCCLRCWGWNNEWHGVALDVDERVIGNITAGIEESNVGI